MRLAPALKTVEMMEKSPVYSLLDELLWCGKSETPILSVTGGQDEEVTNDINLLRRRLETERKRLMQELEGLKTKHATEISELERRYALEKRLGDQLAEVKHALHKFDRGTYGVCDFCGHPIDPGRVEAFPQASLCLNCKAHEGGRKRQGDSGRKNSAYEESKAIPPIQ